MLREVERIGSSQVSADELKLAKNAWALSLAGDFETTGDITATEGDLFVYGLGRDYYGGLAKRIDKRQCRRCEACRRPISASGIKRSVCCQTMV
jgi:hypothetical protein